MTDDVITLDTRIAEPPAHAGEAELLLFALERSRAQFAWKCGGLDRAALNRTQPPSTLTLAGLIKHLALVEDVYTVQHLTGGPISAPWDGIDFDADPGWEWRTAADDTPAQLYGLWQAAVGRTRAALAATLAADASLDQRTGYVSPAGASISLRRLLIDLHDEYARHVGHADMLREAVDGLVGEDPPQA